MPCANLRNYLADRESRVRVAPTIIWVLLAGSGAVQAQDWNALCGTPNPGANGCDVTGGAANSFTPAYLVGTPGPMASTGRSGQVGGSDEGTSFSWAANPSSAVRIGPAVSNSSGSFARGVYGGSYENSARLGKYTLAATANAKGGRTNESYGTSNIQSSAGFADTWVFSLPDASNDPLSPLYRSTATLRFTVGGQLSAATSDTLLPAESYAQGQFLVRSFLANSSSNEDPGGRDGANVFFNEGICLSAYSTGCDSSSTALSRNFAQSVGSVYGDVASLGGGVFEVTVDLFGQAPQLEVGGYLLAGAYVGSGGVTGSASARTSVFGNIGLVSVNRSFDVVALSGVPVQMVPEPHEWAMMLAGLGLVGAVARKRAAKAAIA